MDFSNDEKTLMCNNSRFELLFFDLNIKPAKIHNKLDHLKDEKWETYLHLHYGMACAGDMASLFYGSRYKQCR